MTGRGIARWLLGLAYLVAGVLHIVRPAPFLTITPGWVPMAGTVIFLTGLAEIAGAVALLQTRAPMLRQWAGMGLAAYAVCVFPANIHHFAMDMRRTDGGIGLGYHVPRMFAQPVLVWLALWTASVTDWPWRRTAR